MKIFNHLPNYRYYDAEGTDSVPCDTKYDKLRNLCIYGNSVQDGTPSPDNPIEIQSVGEKTKNLCEKMTFISNGVVIVNPYKDGFKATAKEGASGYNNYVKSTVMLHLNKLEWGKTYTLSYYAEQSNPNMSSLFRVGYTNATNNSWVDFANKSVTNNSVNVITFTLPDEQPKYMGADKGGAGSNGVQFLINVQRATLDTLETITITDIMLVEGTIPAEYEPANKYKIPIKVSGKNLFDISLIPNTKNITNNQDGTLTIIATENTGGYCNTTKKLSALCPDLKVGDVCVLSGDTNAINSYNKPTTYILLSIPKTSWRFGNEYARTITQDDLDSLVVVYGSADTSETTISNIQIERGTTVTPYEPYQESKTYNIFLDEPLRKAGDYADYIDFKSGKLVRNIREFVLNEGNYKLSGEHLTDYNNKQTTNRYVSFYDKKIVLSNGKNFASMTTHLPFCVTVWTKAAEIGYCTNSDVQFHLRMSNATLGINAEDDGATRTQKMQEYINNQYNSETPIVLYYAMSTQNETEIDLPEIKLHKGTNIISVGDTIASSKIEVQYLN